MTDQLEQLCSSFVNKIENQLVPKTGTDLRFARKLQEEAIEEDERLQQMQMQLASLLRSHFNLKESEGDPFQVVPLLLQRERKELEALKKELEEKKALKTTTNERLREIEDNFEKLKTRFANLDSEEKGLQSASSKASARLIASLMQTKFEMDSHGKSVSLILNHQRKVERVTRVDKENTPEGELRDNIWKKFLSLYQC